MVTVIGTVKSGPAAASPPVTLTVTSTASLRIALSLSGSLAMRICPLRVGRSHLIPRPVP